MPSFNRFAAKKGECSMFEVLQIASRPEVGVVRFTAGLGAGAVREEAASWLDGLLNEALDESFPASDPISSLTFD
jgi:hypothetical protein